MKRLALVAAVAALAGCANLFPQSACAPPASAPPVKSAAVEAGNQKQEDLMWELSTKSIYFDHGSFAIKPEYRDFLAKVYRFLQSAPELSIGLIGNADERGHTQSADGQKRADAVREAFMSLGLPDHRMQAVSLGDKNPRATCHEEKCWAQNRRVDIVFLGSVSANNKPMASVPAR